MMLPGMMLYADNSPRGMALYITLCADNSPRLDLSKGQAYDYALET